MNPSASSHANNSTLWRIVGNAASLLTTDLLNKATTFVIYALTARYLGAEAFGQFSLGLLLVYVFQVFASVGLPNLLTREIAQRTSRAPRLLSGGLVVAILASLLAMLAMIGTAVLMQYDQGTTLVIVVLSLGLLPYAGSQVFEASFRGTQRMHYIAISNVVANSVKVVGAVWMLQHGYGTLWLAGLLVWVRVLILLTDAFLYFGWSQQRLAACNRRFVVALVRRSSTFLGIDAAIAGWSAVDALILSKFMGELEVGLYCAATQLLQPASLVYMSIVGSIFPAMCRRNLQGQQQLYKLTRWMVAFLLMLGLPAVVLIVAFADVILIATYKQPEFLRSVPVMCIASFALIAQCFTTILGHSLWAADRESDTLRIVVTNLIANVIISSITISTWGLVGAAAGTLLVSFLNVLQHYLAFYRVTGRHAIDWQIATPVFSAVVMACVVWCLPTSLATSLATAAIEGLPISIQQWIGVFVPAPQRFVLGGLGLVAYMCMVLGIISMAHGGPRKLRDGFFAPLVS